MRTPPHRSESRTRTVAAIAAIAVIALFLPLAPRSARGGIPDPAADTRALTAERGQELVLAAADAVERMYVDPEKGRIIADALRRSARDGGYSGIRTVTALADRLSRDLQEIGHDKHLSARFDPAAGERGPRIRVGPPDAPESGGPGEGNRPGPEPGGRAGVGAGEGSGGGGSHVRIVRGPGPPDPMRAELQRRTNFGIHAVERLDGNVGYLDVREFAPLSASKDTVAASMAFLANSDAIIVDLRNCPGGSPDTVSFLASYFFQPGRHELFSRYDRIEDATRVEYTMEDLPGRAMPDTGLWILVGPDTASAGESFAYLLQQFGRATVVGERTAGAGYNVVTLPLGDGLVVGISVARPIHPKTGKGWEGDGVRPDVAAALPDALPVAHAAALRRLAGSARDAGRRRELEWAVERVSPPAARTAVASLAALAGRYGERTVTIENGRLFCRAPNGRSRAMDPVGADGFTWDEQTRASFTRTAAGRPVELVLERADGTVERFARRSAGEETR